MNLIDKHDDLGPSQIALGQGQGRQLTESHDSLPLLSEIRSAQGRSSQRKPRARVSEDWRDRGLLSAAVAGILVVTLGAVGLAYWGISALSGSPTAADPAAADPVVGLSHAPLSSVVDAPSSSVPPQADIAAVVDGRCRDLRDGPVSVSSGRGGVSGGVAVIERFTFSVYVLRSATAARSVVDANGAVSPSAQLQEWINRRPQGTRHCVKVTARGAGQWVVETTELRPESSPAHVFHQIVRTRDDSSGRTWITAITADPEKGN